MLMMAWAIFLLGACDFIQAVYLERVEEFTRTLYGLQESLVRHATPPKIVCFPTLPFLSNLKPRRCVNVA